MTAAPTPSPVTTSTTSPVTTSTALPGTAAASSQPSTSSGGLSKGSLIAAIASPIVTAIGVVVTYIGIRKDRKRKRRASESGENGQRQGPSINNAQRFGDVHVTVGGSSYGQK